MYNISCELKDYEVREGTCHGNLALLQDRNGHDCVMIHDAAKT